MNSLTNPDLILDALSDELAAAVRAVQGWTARSRKSQVEWKKIMGVDLDITENCIPSVDSLSTAAIFATRGGIPRGSAVFRIRQA